MSLNIKQIKLINSNSYLITNDNNESILVDTGSTLEKDVLLEKIKDEKIKLIIITHGHGDRIGNVKELSDKYSCPVFMSKNDCDLFSDQLSHKIYADGLANKMTLNKIKKLSEGATFEMPSKLVDAINGDTFGKYGFEDVKIISLPGHTRGSIGILVGKKDLLAGDTLITDSKDRVSLPEIYEEKASLLNSLELIKDAFPSKIYPGKGEIFNYGDYFEMQKISLKKEPINIGKNKRK